MILKFLIASYLALFCLAGCLFLPQSLKALKQVGASQAEIETYLARQVKLFDKLLVDLKREALKQGMPKNKIIATYGEPVLAKEVTEPSSGQVLLYRHPTEYFQSDRVYLYFNQKGKLIRWEHKPRGI
ncbi:MAG: hypothetical protein ABIE75_05445 [Candidatus Omnitrophota bacterium]